MTAPGPKEQVQLLTRDISELISEEALLNKIKSSVNLKKPLTVKAGFDPSSSDIHLGHTVLLSKLRQFQDLGHQVVFIIGDATARIGDPSGQNQTRPVLTEKEIKTHARSYQDQAFKILNAGKTKTVFNNDWFGKMGLKEMMDLASRVTVSQILQRDDFQKRQAANSPISILELFYPLMQAYDSVMVKADIELGGTDQKFNLLLGREMQKAFGQEPQMVMMLPLLVGLDGNQKMSKSLKNHVGVLDDAKEMFGKIMSISDDLMKEYYNLLTPISGEEIQEKIHKGELHPKEAKAQLAKLIAERFHGQKKALSAEEEFNKIFSKRQNPSDMPEFTVSGSMSLLQVLTQSGMVPSGNEARRLVKQRAVSLEGEILTDAQVKLKILKHPKVLKIGKRKFIKIKPF